MWMYNRRDVDEDVFQKIIQKRYEDIFRGPLYGLNIQDARDLLEDCIRQLDNQVIGRIDKTGIRMEDMPSELAEKKDA